MEFHWGPSAKAQVRSTVKPSCSDSLRMYRSFQHEGDHMMPCIGMQLQKTSIIM